MPGRLAEKTAVVTGAGRGLGRAIALGFAEEGARLFICDIVPEELDRSTEALRARGARVEPLLVDLSRAEACQGFVDRVLGSTDRLDVLVNNAAVLKRAAVEDLSAENWSETLAVNLTAPFLLTRGFLPLVKHQGGSIINLSSRAGVLGFAGETAYCASKFALEGLTRALAAELRGSAVSVNSVTPGLPLKPTSLSERDAESRPERKEWQDPALLAPAFVCLARLRGEVSGLRFDAHRLAGALDEEGFDLPPERIKALAEGE
jgi:3-oxoacyl-[acyl-carrier protein] reductase